MAAAHPGGRRRAAGIAAGGLALATAVLASAGCGSDGFGHLPPPVQGELPGTDLAARDPGAPDAAPLEIPLPSDCPNPPPDGTVDPLRVLFVGNSYTGTNDLPGAFGDLARAARRKVAVDRQVHDGWTLGSPPDDFASDPAALAALARGWDVVVLQEQSQIPAYPDLLESGTVPGAGVLAAAARDANPCTRIVLFQTWGRRDGMAPDFADFDAMQDALAAGYARAADAVGGEVAPVGEAWRRVLRSNPGLALFAADGSHPAPAGTYLAACTLHGRVFRHPTLGLPAPAGTPAIPVLQQAADDVQGW